MALKRLQTELKDLMKSQFSEFSCFPTQDFFKWEGVIFGPCDSPYEGGTFKFIIEFPSEYPIKPPTFKFISKMYHPNIYIDGKPCISILNQGEDVYGYESKNERWSAISGVSTILLSIINMLAEPNLESPANVDAAKLYRENPKEFNRMVYQTVKIS